MTIDRPIEQWGDFIQSLNRFVWRSFRVVIDLYSRVVHCVGTEWLHGAQLADCIYILYIVQVMNGCMVHNY